MLKAGGQGVVCIYEDTQTKEKFAVKFDPFEGNPNVITECLFLKDYSENLTTVPKYKLHATTGGRRYLIMEFLQKSIE